MAAATLAMLLFCNLPGQLVATISLTDEFPPSSWFNFFWGIEKTVSFQHGWPLTAVLRPDDRSRAFDEPGVLDCWTLWRNNPQFRPWAIAVNALIVLAMAAVSGGAFETWRRMRQNIWQLHVRDVMAITLVLSLWASRGSQHSSAATNASNRS